MNTGNPIVRANTQLAAALGVPCPANLSRLTLVLQPCKWPEVHAEFRLPSADGLVAVVHQLQLQPVPVQAAGSAGQGEVGHAA